MSCNCGKNISIGDMKYSYHCDECWNIEREKICNYCHNKIKSSYHRVYFKDVCSECFDKIEICRYCNKEIKDYLFTNVCKECQMDKTRFCRYCYKEVKNEIFTNVCMECYDNLK